MAHMLVLDDDATTRQFLRDVLEKLLHHTVDEAADVETAVEMVGQATYELLFLDRNLPDGNVLDFCQTIAQLHPHHTMPKWIITGDRPMEWDDTLWARYDVRGYVVKPFRIDAIQDILQQCLHDSNV